MRMKEKKGFRITLGSFDLIKGLAMIFFVVGHSLAPYRSSALIQTRLFSFIGNLGYCMMPALLFASGYMFKPKNPKKVWNSVYSKIIKPYLIVTLVIATLYPYILYFYSWSGTVAMGNSIGYVVAYLLGVPSSDLIIFGYDVQWIGAVWYLLASAIAMNVANFILRIRKELYQILAVLLIFGLGWILLSIDFNYYCIPQGLIATTYFYMGYVFKKYKLLERCANSIWTYVVLIPIVFTELYYGYFDLNLGQFRYGILDCIGAGFTAIFIMLIGVRLGRIEWCMLDWIKTIGVYSYWIIFIHSVDMALPHWYDLAHCGLNKYLTFMMIVGIRTIIIAAGCMIIKKISEKKYMSRRIHA